MCIERGARVFSGLLLAAVVPFSSTSATSYWRSQLACSARNFVRVEALMRSDSSEAPSASNSKEDGFKVFRVRRPMAPVTHSRRVNHVSSRPQHHSPEALNCPVLGQLNGNQLQRLEKDIDGRFIMQFRICDVVLHFDLLGALV